MELELSAADLDCRDEGREPLAVARGEAAPPPDPLEGVLHQMPLLVWVRADRPLLPPVGLRRDVRPRAAPARLGQGPVGVAGAPRRAARRRRAP